MEKKNNKRTLQGTVVSNKMKDTVVVSVVRFVKHPKYQKFMKITKKLKAHNPGNTALVGDKVFIEESRPISKDKHFIVVNG
ncbi:MAG: 30S ribosomal protein S17 [Candidatus Pacebacteria bacterium]|jgi:small subunit ribosomal protein S17|nr:30S ribosomal protein S17 [Candidatus Paceibacterota bacterium]